MNIYGLKNCDTCRKALKMLKSYGQEAVLIDVRVDGISQATLDVFHQEFGADLINTRSTTWRGLSESERQAEPLALLALHPALMKRPVIEHDGTYHLGWSKDVQEQLMS